MHRIIYYYGTTEVNGEQRICRRKSWIVSNKPLPTGEEQDWTDTEIDPHEFEDEFGNLRYIKTGAEPVLKEIIPTQKQKDDLAEKEYKAKLREAMPDIIDKCTSWAEVEAEKAKLRAEVTAIKEKAI
jgi:hypothetical protein